MEPNFAECVALTLKQEGGFVDDPHDPGGATNMGITLATYRGAFDRKGTVADLQRMSISIAMGVYHMHYWQIPRVAELPGGVDCAVFDFGVNSGHARAIIGLQRALKVADDGKLGDITLARARDADPHVLIEAVTADRLGMLKRLSTWPRYGKGWTSRVATIHHAALAMIRHGEVTS